MAPSTLIGRAFFGVGERFFNGPRCFHVHAIHTGFARQLEQSSGARVLRVIAMTKSRHAIARFLHRRERARWRLHPSKWIRSWPDRRSFLIAGRNLQSRRRDDD